MCAELIRDFHLDDSKWSTYKSPLPFNLVSYNLSLFEFHHDNQITECT